jgi:hypothetical protein
MFVNEIKYVIFYIDVLGHDFWSWRSYDLDSGEKPQLNCLHPRQGPFRVQTRQAT